MKNVYIKHLNVDGCEVITEFDSVESFIENIDTNDNIETAISLDNKVIECFVNGVNLKDDSKYITVYDIYLFLNIKPN